MFHLCLVVAFTTAKPIAFTCLMNNWSDFNMDPEHLIYHSPIPWKGIYSYINSVKLVLVLSKVKKERNIKSEVGERERGAHKNLWYKINHRPGKVTITGHCCMIALTLIYRPLVKSVAFIYRSLVKSVTFIYRPLVKSVSYIYRPLVKSVAFIYRTLVKSVT